MALWNGVKISKQLEKIARRMTHQPKVVYHRLPCKFCGEHTWQHMDDGKCVFAPTGYKAPEMSVAFDAFFVEHANEIFGPRHTDELHVLFEETFDDVGVTYYLESKQTAPLPRVLERWDLIRSPSNYSFDLEDWLARCSNWAK